MPQAILDSTGAEVDTELIAAIATSAFVDKEIRVVSVYISSDITQVIFFESGSTLLWKQFAGANGGQTHSGAPSVVRGGAAEPLFVVPAGTALTVTTEGANSFISVSYIVTTPSAP